MSIMASKLIKKIWHIVKPIFQLGIPLLITSITRNLGSSKTVANEALNKAAEAGIEELDEAIEDNKEKNTSY